MADTAGQYIGMPRTTAKYTAPTETKSASLNDVLTQIGQPPLTPKQTELLTKAQPAAEAQVYWAGDLSILANRSVSIVGAREASKEGLMRAARLAKGLAKVGVTVVSGLAAGIDTSAHEATIEAGGKTAAVIGTPLSKAYPAQNALLQEQLWRTQLVLSPFSVGATVFKSNFPVRNRVMAALSSGTAIIEASDTSGTLHQAAECQKLGRYLFLGRSLVDNPNLEWPKRFVGKPKVIVFSAIEDILAVIA